jgi:tetratricopeptide (TPR) repeat protein/TolB-like protein
LLPANTVSANANFRSSIAVLGLKNLSSGHDADWLAMAMTQMLSTELANQYKARIITADRGTGTKLNLVMKDKGGYSREVLRALRAELGCDYVVTGSYVALGDRVSGEVRMDLRLQEAISGETLASMAVSGRQSEIFDLVSRAGHQIRMQLGLTVPPDGDVDWRTVLPRNREAARLYSDGLKHLRVSDNLVASESLQKSINLEPDFALGYASLAEALSALGYSARALAVAQKALSLSSSLPEDERMHIEGGYYELNHDWDGAMGAYRHLWQDFPDDVDSALGLAMCQFSAGNWNDALSTLSNVRAVAMSQKDDPRIDLAEALVTARSGDYQRQQILAEEALRKARSSGALLLQARAQLLDADALGQQEKLQEATEVYKSAYETFRKGDDREGAATALVGLGLTLKKQADFNGAQAKMEQARDYFRQVGDDTGLNTASTNLREITRAREQLAEQKSSARSINARKGLPLLRNFKVTDDH